MPEVGGRHFSYSKAGQAQAKAYAKRTGKKITNHRPSSPSGKRKKPTQRTRRTY